MLAIIEWSNYSVFFSSDFVAMWKEIQKECEKYLTFKKCRQTKSSFTKEAMKLYAGWKERGVEGLLTDL